jgi:hypothetical protein
MLGKLPASVVGNRAFLSRPAAPALTAITAKGDHSQDGITSVEVHQCIECIEARRSNIQAGAAGSGGQSR